MHVTLQDNDVTSVALLLACFGCWHEQSCVRHAQSYACVRHVSIIVKIVNAVSF